MELQKVLLKLVYQAFIETRVTSCQQTVVGILFDYRY